MIKSGQCHYFERFGAIVRHRVPRLASKKFWSTIRVPEREIFSTAGERLVVEACAEIPERKFLMQISEFENRLTDHILTVHVVMEPDVILRGREKIECLNSVHNVSPRG